MKLHKVYQRLVASSLSDVAGEVRRQLDALLARGLRVPQGDVAITAGSRGIDNIALVTRTAGEWLRERGARPFLVPSMGSHNGATAEGQQAMIESLGMTEKTTGMPIRAGMQCVQVGQVATGGVWMDRACYESAGVLVINRIKLHTSFTGPLQSGLAKMMVVGLGKIGSAQTLHRTPTAEMSSALEQMGRIVLNTGKVWAGLAMLEDGFDLTAEVHAIAGDEILEKEPALLEKHRAYFPRLPVDELNVLVVDQIGKTFSGTGMDTNVIGRRGIRGGEDLHRPRISTIAALGLSDASHGNAVGVGLADFVTRRLRDAIDERKTYLNAYTTGHMDRAKIPATLTDDQEVIESIRTRYGDARWMFVPNTLQLGTLYVTDDLLDEIQANPICDVRQEAELAYESGRIQLDW